MSLANSGPRPGARAAKPAEARLEACLDLLRSGRAAEAARACRSLLNGSLKRSAKAWAVLALAERQAGRPQAALAAAERACALAPGWDEAQRLRGGALLALNRAEAAVAALERACALGPDDAEGWSMLGSALKAAGQAEAAVEAQRRAVARAPQNPEIRFNLANALAAVGSEAEAEAAFAAVLAARPSHWRAALNLARLRKARGDLEAARSDLEAAVARHPDVPELAYNLALVELQLGLSEGWRRYEARLALPGFGVNRLDGPLWDGSDLSGRRLTVMAEQGLGDTLQFARYVPGLRAAGAGEIVFAVQPPLVSLLAAAGLADRVVPLAEAGAAGAGGLWCPLLSLPARLPAASPDAAYLSPDAGRRAIWRDRLAALPGRRIGVMWQGNPGYAADAERSFPLEALAPLADLPGCSLVSLQQGYGREQAATWVADGRLSDWTGELDPGGGFRDTAALVAELDLVVCCDTVAGHLAGAVGTPVALLLPAVPDWRWPAAGDDPRWYPTHTLLRQGRRGDWSGPVARLVAGLSA